jgi:hypothetical protein
MNRLSAQLWFIVSCAIFSPVVFAARLNKYKGKRRAPFGPESFGRKEGAGGSISITNRFEKRLRDKSKSMGLNCSCKWEQKATAFSDAVARVSAELEACKGSRGQQATTFGNVSTAANMSYATGKGLSSATAGKQTDFLIHALLLDGSPR